MFLSDPLLQFIRFARVQSVCSNVSDFNYLNKAFSAVI